MKVAPALRDLARWAQYGQPRTPANLHVGESYTSFYWDNHSRLIKDFETWQRVAALSERYKRFVYYCREIKPQWSEVKKVYYADNSVESVQVSNTGVRREVLVVGPSGDVCF